MWSDGLLNLVPRAQSQFCELAPNVLFELPQTKAGRRVSLYLWRSVDVEHQRLVLRDHEPGLLPAPAGSFLHVVEKTADHAVLRRQRCLLLQTEKKKDEK